MVGGKRLTDRRRSPLGHLPQRDYEARLVSISRISALRAQSRTDLPWASLAVELTP